MAGQNWDVANGIFPILRILTFRHSDIPMHRSVVQLDPRDNALVALADLKAGDKVDFGGRVYTLPKTVPAKHKFAMRDLEIGDDILMYGVLVGKAAKPISAAELLTTTNVRHEASDFHEQSTKYEWASPDTSRWKAESFLGYRRSDGQVGTRNYWLVVPLVFCENKNIQVLKRALEEELGLAPPQLYRRQVAALAKAYREGRTKQIDLPVTRDATPSVPGNRLFENVDGIRFLLHDGGCGGTREDSNNLCGLVAGYIHHPNVAGATVLSLGCQHAQAGILREEIRKRNPRFDKPLFVLEQQRSGSEAAMMSEALGQTFSGLVEANKAQRTSAALSELCVGLKCGGSDGFSGISANPAIGHAADLIAALGGRTILSEFPELCGVEQELINRSRSTAVGHRFIQLMRDYAARAAAVHSGFDMNPSPGNMRDGLLTDAMKSAGAAKKGGTSPVAAVLDYPEYSTEPGLNLQCTPAMMWSVLRLKWVQVQI
jgi:altronate hydrolase